MEDAVQDLPNLQHSVILFVTQPFTQQKLEIPIDDTVNFLKMFEVKDVPPIWRPSNWVDKNYLNFVSTTNNRVFGAIANWVDHFRNPSGGRLRTEFLVEIDGVVQYKLTSGYPFQYSLIRRNGPKVRYSVGWQWEYAIKMKDGKPVI